MNDSVFGLLFPLSMTLMGVVGGVFAVLVLVASTWGIARRWEGFFKGRKQ